MAGLLVITGRAAVQGARNAISSTHYLATEAGMRVFRRGGNAVDAGVAAGVALGVVERDLVDLGGVAPIILHRPGMAGPATIDGLGRWPLGLTLDRYLDRYSGTMPPGVARSVTPAALDSWLTALAEYGSLPLSGVLEPAIELAAGFPMYPRLAAAITAEQELLRQWPSSASVFLPDGRPPEVGEQFVQSDLRRLLTSLVDAERTDEGDRAAGIRAAREHFYRGDPAVRIAAFMRSVGGGVTEKDLAAAAVEIGAPARSGYRGVEVHACGAWSQGPVVPMALNILEHSDLAGLDADHPLFLHRCAEALKLAFADREAYFGDPGFVDVPLAGLLDKDYARARFDLISDRGNPRLPPAGDPWQGSGVDGRVPPSPILVPGPPGRDTAYVAAMDAAGNAFSATPSDSGLSSPLVPGLGIIVSTRGSQLRLDPAHPSCIAPGKRPRLTPNPALLMREGRAVMAFGCPGGDAQPQAMVQVTSRMIDFGLGIQDAIERPRVVTLAAPDSFHPHGAQPGVLLVESRIGDGMADLAARGHLVRELPPYSRLMGAVCAVRTIGTTLEAGADPRRDCMAAAW